MLVLSYHVHLAEDYAFEAFACGKFDDFVLRVWLLPSKLIARSKDDRWWWYSVLQFYKLFVARDSLSSFGCNVDDKSDFCIFAEVGEWNFSLVTRFSSNRNRPHFDV